MHWSGKLVFSILSLTLLLGFYLQEDVSTGGATHDFYHFVLQFFFISSWGFEDGPSFNGPIWSVSIEIFIYGIFFLSVLLVFINLRALALVGLYMFAFLSNKALQNKPLAKTIFSKFPSLSKYLFSTCLNKKL